MCLQEHLSSDGQVVEHLPQTKGSPVSPICLTSHNFVLPLMPFPAVRCGTTLLNLKGDLLLCGHKEKGKRKIRDNSCGTQPAWLPWIYYTVKRALWCGTYLRRSPTVAGSFLMNLQPEEKENRSFCIKWISTHGCAFKAFLKKVNTGGKNVRGKAKLWMYCQTLLPKKEKNRPFKYHPHQEQTCLSSVCTYIYISMLRFRWFFVSFLIQGRRELQESLRRITTGEKAQSSRWSPSSLHSFILGQVHLYQLSSGLHH